MTTYYVATNGSNSGKGTSNSPWRTIGEAMKANLRPGDDVVVRSGTYKEAVVVNKDGAAGNYITVRSEVPGGAKIVSARRKARRPHRRELHQFRWLRYFRSRIPA